MGILPRCQGDRDRDREAFRRGAGGSRPEAVRPHGHDVRADGRAAGPHHRRRPGLPVAARSRDRRVRLVRGGLRALLDRERPPAFWECLVVRPSHASALREADAAGRGPRLQFRAEPAPVRRGVLPLGLRMRTPRKVRVYAPRLSPRCGAPPAASPSARQTADVL